MNTIISIAPLSQAYKKQLEKTFTDHAEYYTVAQLRQQTLFSLFKQLRGMRPAVLICAIEDEASLVTSPILIMLSALTQAKKMQLYRPDTSIVTLKKRQALSAATQTLIASLASILTAYKTKRHLQQIDYSAPHHPTNTLFRKEKVFFMNANLWFGVQAGGSVGHIAGVVNAFQRNHGLHVTYASVFENTHLSPDISQIKLETPRHFGLPTELNYYRFSEQVTQQLLPALQNNKPDFLYQRLSICNDSGLRLAEQTGLPLVLEYNGSEVWCAEKWGNGLKYPKLALQTEEACLRGAHRIVTISEALRQELIDRKIPSGKIICYPNGIDPELFNPKRFTPTMTRTLRSRYQLTPQHSIATFIGTFGPWHGVDLLAQVIRELIDETPHWLHEHRLHFLLIGDGQKMPVVKNLLNQPGDEAFVTLTGLVAQEEAPLHLAASDLLLSPHVPNPDGSPFFGSPTKLFEYMAMEKPIIASRLGQISEVLKPALQADQLPLEAPDCNNQATAVLCKPGNTDEIKQALRFLLAQPEWQSPLGKNARQTVLARYTWKHHTQVILDAL